VFAIEKDGRIFVGGQLATTAEIEDLQTAEGLSTKPPVVIRAHRETPYASVVSVLNALQAAGFANIAFQATEEEKE